MVELNPLALNPAAIQMMAASSLYQGGRTLEDDVDAQTWERLLRSFQALGMPVQFIASQKPWMAAMTLSALSAKQRGLSEGLGIDMHFLQQAQGSKEIVELESMEMQTRLLAELPVSAQVAMLEDALRILEEKNDYFDDMINVWKTGDVEGMNRLIAESLDDGEASEALAKSMLDDRNRNMMKKISHQSGQGGTAFVVVGAAHLVGPDGLVELMRQAGYQVIQQ